MRKQMNEPLTALLLMINEETKILKWKMNLKLF